MPIAIFDVDGTLTCTTGVDDHSLATAWSRVFGIREEAIDTDWTTYAHSTDDGLTLEVAQRHLGRGPTRAEVGEVQREFFGLLRERIAENPGRCVPVAGVEDALGALAERGWSVGIASGAWEESARIKLAAAGVRAEHLPGTFSHVHQNEPATREQIIRGTVEKLGSGVPVASAAPGSSRPVYIGDGPWDARAARKLGFGFVGIRVDNEQARLRAEGATVIFQNYLDLVAMLEAVEGAAG